LRGATISIAFVIHLLLKFIGMKKSELEPLISSLLPKFFSFAFSLIPDELQAEQMVIDAYSVFLIREKDFIEELEYDPKSKREKSRFKKYLLKNLVADVYKLGIKRSSQLRHLNRENIDYQAYYQIEISQRAVIFMKDVLGFSIEDIQEILNMKKYQVIERLYNARNNLMLAQEVQLNADGV
jgi:hypothetical protein